MLTIGHMFAKKLLKFDIRMNLGFSDGKKPEIGKIYGLQTNEISGPSSFWRFRGSK